ILIAGITGLVAVVLPAALLMVIAVFGLGLFFVAQYFLWARWMYAWLMKKEAEKAAAAEREGSVSD
ncbi:MAG: hypothetical protein KDA85_05910, partial [Planctomycetaceae bacterium]|nr:hypothetical protein [Planctomycetaceae bacterium]